MKNFKLLLVIVLFTVSFSACKSTQNLPQQRPDFIENKIIAIRFDSAEPNYNRALEELSTQGILDYGNTAGNISLVASKNYLKIKQDSIKAYLPYFGSRQGVSMRDNLGAIEFNDTPKNYTMVYNAEKRRTEISFSINQKDSNENYSVILYINNAGGSVLNINSSNRARIAFRGEATALKTEKY